jgi:bacterioferritin-associated ferredoxin
MYVCICKAVTENQIRAAAESGSADLWHLQSVLGVAAGCGTCRDAAASILVEYRTAARTKTAVETPVLYYPAAG